jgi:serine/threonine-protein kinase HipA
VSLVARTLRVFLHGRAGDRRAIAHLSQLGDYLRIVFDDDYIEDASRPTLSLAYRGATDEHTRKILRSDRDGRLVRADRRLPTFFQNLLPEGHNRERLALARGCSEDDELELLAAAGHDLMGALEVEPVPGAAGIPESVRAWHAAMGLTPIEPEAEQLAAPLEDAASLPGVVTKFSAIKEGRRYVVKRRSRAGSYIVKLPSTRHPDLVENELSGYRLAGSIGLQCASATRVSRADAELPVEVPFPHVLAVKRFDRGPKGRRIHMEEMAQAFGYEPRAKYGRGIAHDFPALLRVLDRLSGHPSEDVVEAARRLIAFVLMGNTDAHLKNWALLYPDGVTPILAPLYDPVCVSAWFDELPEGEYQLNRRIDATLSALDLDALTAMARIADVPRIARLRTIMKDTVREARARWPRILRDAPDNVRASVTKRLEGGVGLTR